MSSPSSTPSTTASAAPASLAGRTAVVTGSTSGIGAATAHHLAARGAHVVVTGRDGVRGRGGGRRHRRRPAAPPSSSPGDLTASPAHAARPRRAPGPQALGGRIDVLVHNAAVCPAVDTVSLTDDDLETTLAVNVRAPQVLTAAIAPAMVERGSGAIVVVGSWMASIGHAFVGFYSATKAAEAQLARSWAAEFGPGGVRVNTVAPGATRTPINAADDDVITRMTSTTPAGRPGTPDEVAATMGWLASDEASYIHGALIPVDGGITATR